jgi:APA family basic amino acid/polyamine antiporter
MLRYLDPSRVRPFKVPFVWPVTILGAAACIYTMFGLPRTAWERFGIWLVIGLALYFTYGFRNSTLRRGTDSTVETPPA